MNKSIDFCDVDPAPVVGVVRKVQLTPDYHVFVRVVPGTEIGAFADVDDLDDDSKRTPYYLSLFLANEDGSPKYPNRENGVLERLKAWPAGYQARALSAGFTINAMAGDISGN